MRLVPARPLAATRAIARRTLGQLVAFALPSRCPGCGAITPADHTFCVTCWQSLDFQNGPACATCGLPFPYATEPGARCAPCLAAPPVLDGMRAAVGYGDIPRRMALRLKHGRRPGLAETIARLMLRIVDSRDALIVPVPLHRWRIWSRGYNQSALIARALARHTGMAMAPDLLVRTRPTPMLRGLGRAARAQTVRDAFAVTGDVAGRAILLIDDVFTTGATANACAGALRRAGAGHIRLACWARVPLERVGTAADEIDNQPAPTHPWARGRGE